MQSVTIISSRKVSTVWFFFPVNQVADDRLASEDDGEEKNEQWLRGKLEFLLKYCLSRPTFMVSFDKADSIRLIKYTSLATRAHVQ